MDLRAGARLGIRFVRRRSARCGMACAFRELEHLPEWLARGYAGEMNYLRDPRRADPRLALEGARSLIVVAMNYNAPQPRSEPRKWAKRERRKWLRGERGREDHPPRGRISRYAWGDDYHEVLREKLNALVAVMRDEFPEPFEARAHVDTGPVIERVAAKYAGLGWLAKNTMLINQQLGSWLFLGVILTTLELAPSLAPGEAPAADLCGSCTRCLDACRRRRFHSRTCSTRDAVFPTSQLSCAALFRKNFAPGWATRPSAATFVRMSVHGIAKHR